MIKLTKQAKLEQEKYMLLMSADYNHRCADYIASYSKRKPAKDVPNKNMIKALRMGPWHNSADDWARLHITEAFLKSANS